MPYIIDIYSIIKKIMTSLIIIAMPLVHILLSNENTKIKNIIMGVMDIKAA